MRSKRDGGRSPFLWSSLWGGIFKLRPDCVRDPSLDAVIGAASHYCLFVFNPALLSAGEAREIKQTVLRVMFTVAELDFLGLLLLFVAVLCLTIKQI